MPKVSINLVTVREGGLDWQLKHLARQTFKDFEVVVVDGHYDARHTELAQLAERLKLNFRHIKPPTLNYVTELNHASSRNLALSCADADIVIFFDDYQMPHPNFVETHMRYTKIGLATATRQFALHMVDRDYSDEYGFVKENELEHGDPRQEHGYTDGIWPDGGLFWTNNASMRMEDLVKLNGFDERYNGGTAGEDTDVGVRFLRTGGKMLYSMETTTLHIHHGSVPALSFRDDIKALVGDLVALSKCDHSRDPFTYNQFHKGDRELVEHGTLHTVRLPDGIKYYICKNCGCIGPIDSIEIHNAGEAEKRVRALEDLFTVPTSMTSPHTYVKVPFPKEVLAPLAGIYEGTKFTYYKELLHGL